jgi:hypothetical protein
MSSDEPSGNGEPPVAAAELSSEELFLAPDAVPRRRNQMMAVGLAVVAALILAIVVTLMLLIRYENLPSLFSYFA